MSAFVDYRRFISLIKELDHIGGLVIGALVFAGILEIHLEFARQLCRLGFAVSLGVLVVFSNFDTLRLQEIYGFFRCSLWYYSAGEFVEGDFSSRLGFEVAGGDLVRFSQERLRMLRESFILGEVVTVFAVSGSF